MDKNAPFPAMAASSTAIASGSHAPTGSSAAAGTAPVSTTTGELYEHDTRASHEDEYRGLISPSVSEGNVQLHAKGLHHGHDEDLEADASGFTADGDDGDNEDGAGVPFPSQQDPAKPLRPKHYRKKRAQRGIHKWFNRNIGVSPVLSRH